MLSKVLAVELQDIMVVHKINESVTSIASILEINWKIEEVNNTRPMVVFRKFVKKHFLGVFVRDVSNHQRRSRVQAILYGLQIQFQILPISCISKRPNTSTSGSVTSDRPVICVIS